MAKNKDSNAGAPKTPYSTAGAGTARDPGGNDTGLSAHAVARQFEALAESAAPAAAHLAEAADVIQPAAAPSTNFAVELNNIDFKKMIGGPLQACIDAQVASSMATVDFIQKVGFKQDGGGGSELVMVDFTHKKSDVDAEGNATEKTNFIKVPLLALLPIHSLRLEQVLIDFHVKLNSVETSSVSDKLGVDVGVEGGWGPVKFKVSASYQRQSASGVEVKKEYSLHVNVKAVQDDMPAGLEKILGMLAA